MDRREFLGLLAAGAIRKVLPRIEAAVSTQMVVTDWPVLATGWADFNVGDVITISGRYAYNPITRERTDHLKHFLITAKTENGFSIMPDPVL